LEYWNIGMMEQWVLEKWIRWVIDKIYLNRVVNKNINNKNSFR